MGSIFGSFHAATVSLQQDQLALDATANNISNQNTAGYARRAVTWTDGDSVTLSGKVPPEVPNATVTAQRSSVLDGAVVSAAAAASSASTVQEALNTLQASFAVNSSGNESSGVNAAMSGFFAAMQSVAGDPTSASARQSALVAAQGVASSFQSTSKTLEGQAAGLSATIQAAVGIVNQLSTSIAALNRGIANESSPAGRDSLIDQRTAQIQSLSQLIGLQVTNDSDGSVTLATTSGGALVVGSLSNTLSTNIVGGAARVSIGNTDVTTGLQGGTIGGAISVREGVLATAKSTLDTLAAAFASAVNTANSVGTTTAGAAGGAIFSISAADPAATLTVVAGTGDDFASAGSGEGADGTANANALAALANQKNAAGQTFADTLSGLISSIGTAASSASIAATSANSGLTQAQSAQQTLSGVSLDTEAANLTQYQRSYEAQAKLISILNQIMADTINMGSPTTVS